MRLDLVTPNDGAYALDVLKAAAEFEDMGWDGLWLTDHIVGVAAYGEQYDQQWLEMLTCMTYVAARTSRVRIGAGVLVAPYRDPVTAAKIIATMDVLSGGRIDIGIGTGWARREFGAVGRGDIFEDRGAFTNEVLEVMLACWKTGQIAFDGRWFKLEKFQFAPGPLQGERVPIWIGSRGMEAAPLRRAARFADYWHPTSEISPQELREGGERLDEMAGRKITRTLRINCDGDPQEFADLLAQYQEAGCVQAACAFSQASSLSDFERKAAALFEATASLRKG